MLSHCGVLHLDLDQTFHRATCLPLCFTRWFSPSPAPNLHPRLKDTSGCCCLTATVTERGVSFWSTPFTWSFYVIWMKFLKVREQTQSRSLVEPQTHLASFVKRADFLEPAVRAEPCRHDDRWSVRGVDLKRDT